MLKECMIPLRTQTCGGNLREHWRARTKRVANERSATAWALKWSVTLPWGFPGRAEAAAARSRPLLVRLTRISPRGRLDTGNLPGSLKAVQDQIAEWLGVDDRYDEIVSYSYAQARGPWGVKVEISE
jgi:hypothetical protein